MKKITYLSILTVLFFISCKTDSKKQEDTNKELTEVIEKTEATVTGATHIVDVNQSSILWEGFKPTGAHNGILLLKSGNVLFSEGTLKTASFEIDMTSIANKDMADDDPYKEKLVGHLKSADFFDIEQFPTASFVLKNQVKEADDQLQLTGDLTIKGITKSVTFPYTLSEEGDILKLKSSTFKIDRTEYGIKYKSKNFFKDIKDKFINDEFEVSFDVVLKAK